MKILITICARGGSKGIPGKNIKTMDGKPLIYYTLITAIRFAKNKKTCDIILSTDSDNIKNVVKDLRLPEIDLSYTRPVELGGDTVGKLDVIKHVLNFAQEKNNIQYDYILDMDITSPLRTVTDLENAFSLIEKKQTALNLFSVSPANRNPYFNMVEDTGNGFVTLSKKGHFLTRQSAPKVYDMNASFYIYRNHFFSKKEMKVVNSKSIVYEIPHVCFDLDHPIDFDFMEFLMNNKKLDFLS
ncbi:MAG: acylneuraminate cytidylyltransferase family protein [Petrimonas sp.]|uniref:acylneuraminate cytidylyltransferase family protein n=1 Tax=Petrimonas sp. TaxID=2023866 RepID=UPI002B39C8DD|nr:acylneuraminate cytidylyltransferase family protein [Petrimonas sp.]MEA5045647.1 acylneuraminate cytidylyltransferase family protein [Petrimonas sp.]